MAVISSIPWADRVQILSTPSPAARLQLATSIFSKQASIAEVSQKISTAVDESLTKQQKEYYLRQQLQVIQRELANLNRPSQSGSKFSADGLSKGGDKAEGSNEFDEEGDDSEYFSEMRKKIEAMMPDSEERKMGVKEYRRLKRIPAGSVEHGVIRTYVSCIFSQFVQC
jgi:ATP-dependent Lon protease